MPESSAAATRKDDLLDDEDQDSLQAELEVRKMELSHSEQEMSDADSDEEVSDESDDDSCNEICESTNRQ